MAKLEKRNGLAVIGVRDSSMKQNECNNTFEVDDFMVDLLQETETKVKCKKHKKSKKSTKSKKKAKKKEKKCYKKAKEKTAELNIPKKNNNGYVISEIALKKCNIKNVNGKIYIYSYNKGYYEEVDENKFGTMILEFFENEVEDYLKFHSNETKEGFKLLKMKREIQCEELSNMFNKPYICCENGVVKIDNEIELTEYSHKYEFTRRINAEYNPEAKGEKFKEYLNFVTHENKQLKRLLQKVSGYILSNYDNLRKAFMIVGVKGSGKSLFLCIIRNLLVQENVASINIQDFENEYNRAELLNKAVNIVSDLPESPIKNEISTFKSITSSLDTLTGREPYGKPQNRKCHTKMMFGCNHPPQLKGISSESVEAFFDRMIFIPFDRRVTDDMRDPNLNESLNAEKDYIFTWACKGLQRLIKNKFNFTECDLSDVCKEKYWAKQCPEQSFVKYHLDFTDEEVYESSKKIKKAFAQYCQENNVTAVPGAICNYLESSYGIIKQGSKKRIDEYGRISPTGNPISVYKGIHLI